MTKRLVMLSVLLATVIGMIAAPGTARADDNGGPMLAPGPPPAPQYEVAPVVPGPAYVWVAGHWQWVGRWAWIPGRWEIVPYPGARWVSGYWARAGRGWVWVNGHWAGSGPAYTIVTVPPPATRVDIIGVPPFAAAVWIGGFWRWTGGNWLWVPGYWTRAPWPRAVWVPGYWTRQGSGWIWFAGYWQ
ncbi:MAG TPA: hypothetical protein VKZ50_04665 [bacterium]|nr:hypothetical protein [bacterium]